jgi:superfamily II DNA or RNA helicase
MLYAPTGAGKTEIAIALMDFTRRKGRRAAMVLDRIVLVDQTSKRLEAYGIPHGVMQAKHPKRDRKAYIQICSAQTLEKMGSFPDLDLLIVDEAHQIRTQTKEFIKNNPHVMVVGLSATPFTKGLKHCFSKVVNTVTTEHLVDNKVLTPLRVFLAKEIDMTGATKVAGEWSSAEATERGVKITGDIVSEWVGKTTQIFGGPRKTIVFCASVAHGADLAEKFTAAGYNFVPVSYKDDEDYKKEVFVEFSKPDSSIHGLIAVDILTKGFDVPDVMVGVSARPFTKSLSSHVQQMGRVMRSFNGKEFALWLDHSGNYLRFLDDWSSVYSLGAGELDDKRERTKSEPTEKQKEAAKCPKCGSLWGSGNSCPHCGFVSQRQSLIVVKPGTMQELALTYNASHAEKTRFYQELLGYKAQYRPGYKDGWAAYQFEKKYGHKPKKTWGLPPLPPSDEVKNFMTYLFIKEGKAREAHSQYIKEQNKAANDKRDARSILKSLRESYRVGAHQ